MTMRSPGALAFFALLAACSRTPERATPSASAPLEKAPPAVTASTGPRAPVSPGAPATLLTADLSAYGAQLALDDEAVYLLTRSAAYRLVPGHPPVRWALDLGISPALAGDHLVYWSKGALWRTPKRGGAPSMLAKVPLEPQRLSASGDRFAWLERGADGRFVIWTLEGSRPRKIITPPGDVATLTLLHDQVFFVEQRPGAAYRLGVVPLSGGEPRYSTEKKGRTPAMLAAAGDIFFYDGPSRTVRRVSPDLAQERVLARGVICSPLAAANRVYCAQPAGLLELPAEGGAARVLSPATSGAITKVTASATRVAWLVDRGPDRLAVETLPVR
jgi:hypothetical protein